MKIAAYILSIVVFVLTIIPCIDKPEDNTVAKSLITEQTNNPHQNDIDHCSPFCACQCCQTSFHIPFVQASTIAVIAFLKFSSTNQNLVSNYFFEFYIPPKA